MDNFQVFTSESVSEGHPDKLADQISDALLDECLAQDENARVAIETLLTRGLAVVAGEVTVDGYIDVARVVRDTINEVGYTDTELGLDGNTCGVMVAIQEQSPDIAVGVDRGGAGDQGMMFGMASRETPELMPLPISIAHALTRKIAEVRKAHPSLGLRPDAKSQVSVIYEDGVPKKIDTIVLSSQHSPKLDHEAITHIVEEYVIGPVLEQYGQYVDGDIIRHINPTGIFVIGGPQGDTGVTGRKIIVDTYGGMCPHGGGAFSGKDPTKVDRSAAYMARYVSKNIVAAGLADKVQIAVAYAIGVAQPVSLHIDTYGTEKVDREAIVAGVRSTFDMSPGGIAKTLNLKRQRYLQTAKNGHFGNPAFAWEKTDVADQLRETVLKGAKAPVNV
ncbi:MAG: methionine adenosyltransferase [Armatimonadetes bacterium]|nr:methionine adenosyltransferase [Armatimonadota bacterium]